MVVEGSVVLEAAEVALEGAVVMEEAAAKAAEVAAEEAVVEEGVRAPPLPAPWLPMRSPVSAS